MFLQESQLLMYNNSNNKSPLKLYNVTAPGGHFSIKYQFAHEGTYQIIVNLDSNYSALTLASFKIVVPFQPLGVINMRHILPLLIPAGLVGLIGALAILSLILIANIKKKK